ncbi:hypothetical protein [Streptomyces hygroscopicus]|uniref:hypothetical protein n=1 Tax=Streptomyces hygroscopicus TaxID=1912 RepID=UPI0004CBC955|nr:hypothetical protein [Streptomyces hygroscopicus]GLV79464.1 lipoprotein [Streptomyces hygroscopicus subsp. hygroscopicus]
MRSTTILAALCAATALTLTACGTDGTGPHKDAPAKGSAPAKETTSAPGIEALTGPQIINRALKTTKSATSLTIDMDAIIDGAPMKYHMSSDNKGECTGRMTVDGGTVRLIKTGHTAYMKYDAAFWRSQGGKDGEAAAKLIGDRWTKADASGADAKDLTAMCDSDQLLAGFSAADNAARKGGPATVDGRPAITVTESEGDETYTAYIATEGKPYLLKLVTKGGKEPGTLRLGDFDRPVGAKAPTGDIVDLDTLGG